MSVSADRRSLNTPIVSLQFIPDQPIVQNPLKLTFQHKKVMQHILFSQIMTINKTRLSIMYLLTIVSIFVVLCSGVVFSKIIGCSGIQGDKSNPGM